MKNTKRMVEGAMFCAIYGVFLLISRITGGFLESVVFFILPLPLIIFTFRYGIKNAVAPFVAVFFIALLINPISALFYVLSANILGVVYGQLLRKQVKETNLILLCGICSAVVNTLTMVVFGQLFGYDLLKDLQELLTMIQNSFSGDLTIVMEYVKFLIPAVMLLIGFIEGYAIHFISSFIMIRLKEKVKMPCTYLYLILPKWFIFLFIVFFGVYFLTQSQLFTSEGIVQFVIASTFNLSVFMGFIIAVQGLAFFALLCIKKNKRIVFLTGFLVGIIFLLPYFIGVLILLGCFAVLSELHKKMLYN